MLFKLKKYIHFLHWYVWRALAQIYIVLAHKIRSGNCACLKAWILEMHIAEVACRSIHNFDMKVSKEVKIRNRYNQVPHLTQDTTRESDKNTIKQYTQESQDVSHLPVGDHKAAMNIQENTTNTKHR